VSLLVRLHGVEGLQYNLHKMVLGGNQLLEIDRVNAVGVVGWPLHWLSLVFTI
jgi:hypothetical protein